MQRISGSGNVTVGRDIIRHHQAGGQQPQPDRNTHILRLQGVQITLLLFTLFLLVVNAVKYSNLDRQLEDIRQLANRSVVVSGNN